MSAAPPARPGGAVATSRNLVPSIVASLVVLAVYIGVLAWIPRDVFWHPDEGAKFIGMRTIQWQGTRIRYEIPYPGRHLDKHYSFYPTRQTIYPTPNDGQVSFHWSILFPLLTRPAYDAFGLWGIYVVPILCGWLSAVLAGVWVHRFAARGAPLAILLTGLGSPILFYSLCYFEHTATTLCAGLALTILFLRPGRLSALLWMTPLLGLAIALRLETIGYAAAIFGAWGVTAIAQQRWEPRPLLRPQRSTWLLAALATAALVLSVYLLLDVLPERHAKLLTHWPSLLRGIYHKRNFFFDSLVRIFLGDVRMVDYTMIRVWQISSMIALAALIVGPFADTRRLEAFIVVPALFILLQTSLLTVISMLPFLQRQGVLAVSPFMAVSLMAFPEALRRRDPHLLALATAGALGTAFGFLSLFAMRIALHYGGSLLGLDGAVRYMLWLYPIGAALAVIMLSAYRESDAPPLARSLFAAILAGLMLVSFYYEYLGVRELRAKRAVLTVWREAIAQRPPVVTDIWWLPAVLAPYFTEHELYLVESAGGVWRWMRFAREADVHDFTYATQYRIDPERLRFDGGAEVESTTAVLDLNIARMRLNPAPAGKSP